MELVFIGLCGASVVQDKSGLDITYPIWLECEGIVRRRRLAIWGSLLSNKLARPIELMSSLRERWFDWPISLRRIDYGDFLDDMFPGLCIEGERAVCIRCRALAFNLIDTNIHIRCELDNTRIDTWFLGSELQTQLGDTAWHRACTSFPVSSHSRWPSLVVCCYASA